MTNTPGRILVIEDDQQMRKLYKIKLSEQGYDIVEASNGNEGLRRFRECLPDLVITDLVMPEKEGIEMIMQIKTESPEAKIIAISGGGANQPGVYLKIAKSLGAQKTFAKPVDWPELIAQIKALIG